MEPATASAPDIPDVLGQGVQRGRDQTKQEVDHQALGSRGGQKRKRDQAQSQPIRAPTMIASARCRLRLRTRVPVSEAARWSAGLSRLKAAWPIGRYERMMAATTVRISSLRPPAIAPICRPGVVSWVDSASLRAALPTISNPRADVTKSESGVGVTSFVAKTATSRTTRANAPAIRPNTSPSRRTRATRDTNSAG